MKEYINVLTAFKVAASIIFIWIHSPYNDLYNFGNNLENLYNVQITSYTRFQRLLAKHVHKKELDRSKVRDRISGNNSYNNIKSTSDDLSKYSQLKKKGLNDLDLYKKLYKHRYSKKNVLGKFDCYCEKKIFEKYDRIDELAQKFQKDKKSFNKKVDKNFGIPLISFALIPVLGLIIPLLFNESFPIIKRCFNDCTDMHGESGVSIDQAHTNKKLIKALISKDTWETITQLNNVFLYISTVVVFLVVIYIFIKLIKYKKLKAGRDKMSLKEYYHFTKSLF
ncbi:Plasmodium exported protein, unknown function [Plasmodium vivax]|nr:Plasmodium exported protein, unknown function [Plasmodium vivax]